MMVTIPVSWLARMLLFVICYLLFVMNEVLWIRVPMFVLFVSDCRAFDELFQDGYAGRLVLV